MNTDYIFEEGGQGSFLVFLANRTQGTPVSDLDMNSTFPTISGVGRSSELLFFHVGDRRDHCALRVLDDREAPNRRDVGGRNANLSTQFLGLGNSCIDIIYRNGTAPGRWKPGGMG